MPSATRQTQTSDLLVTYLDDGLTDGWPVVLAHGFPYDVHAFDDVVPLLVERGARVLRPFVRGYGPTSFLLPSTMRSGQQAALGRDLVEFLQSLQIEGAIVAGFDWGGLASCVAAALWPEKIGGLVSYAVMTSWTFTGSVKASLPPWRNRCGISISFKPSEAA